MADKPILVTQPSLPPLEEFVDELRDLWESRQLTNHGIKHQALEQALKDYLKVNQLTLMANGHLALESALEALECTGEVITTPFTFASTTHAIVRQGMKPVFCDIEPSHFTMDPDKIEELITDQTSAIMPVHVYGHICDTKRIETIAKKHQLKVIYDGAHTFGITVNGKSAAQFGDATMLSFHATKVFHTVEGGALVYQDPSLEHTLQQLCNFGFSGREQVDRPGGNAKMNEFEAAMGLCNLKHLNEELLLRKQVMQRYRENLSGISFLTLPEPQSGIESNYAYCPVLFTGADRDQACARLMEANVFPRKYFYPLTSQFAAYRNSTDPSSTPVALEVSRNILTLPLHSGMTPDDVDRICNLITP